MIRTKMMMLAFGALSLSGVSAMAATKTSHHQTKTNTAAVVAQAEGGDAAKPADETKADKKAKKSKAKKAKAGSESAAPAPAPETK
jgi:membrane-associated protease RseP (regulator of RpoE activity)